MIAVVLLTASRPEGDFLFGAGAGSYLFLLGGMAVAVMCATLGWGRQPAGARRPTWQVTYHFAVVRACGSRDGFPTAVMGYGPEVASMVVRAAELPAGEVVAGGGANRENLP